MCMMMVIVSLATSLSRHQSPVVLHRFQTHRYPLTCTGAACWRSALPFHTEAVKVTMPLLAPLFTWKTICAVDARTRRVSYRTHPSLSVAH